MREAKNYESVIKITKNRKAAEAGKLMVLMGRGVKQGETVTVTVEDSDEEVAAAKMEEFFKANLQELRFNININR